MEGNDYLSIELNFNTIDDYSAAIKEFDLEAIQISSGKYINSHSFVELPMIQVGRRSMVCSTVHNGIMMDEALYFIIPDDELFTKFNGYNFGATELLIIPPGLEVSSYFPEDFSASVLSIPIQSLVKNLDLYAYENLFSYLKLFCKSQNSSSQFMRINRLLSNQVKIAIKEQKKLSNQSLDDIQQNIFSILNNFFSNAVTFKKQHLLKIENHQNIVRRVISYLREHQAINVTIPELASIGLCSIGSLENAFKSILNMTPKSYLVKRRMHMIHLILMNEPVPSIRELVNLFGVVNVGRFSNDYFKMFGIYPHEHINQL